VQLGNDPLEQLSRTASRTEPVVIVAEDQPGDCRRIVSLDRLEHFIGPSRRGGAGVVLAFELERQRLFGDLVEEAVGVEHGRLGLGAGWMVAHRAGFLVSVRAMIRRMAASPHRYAATRRTHAVA
jgi:hypothetical protein